MSQSDASPFCDHFILGALALCVASIPFLGATGSLWTFDVIAGAAMAAAALSGHLFVRRLQVAWLSKGWTLITVALILDVLDELSPPELMLTVVEIAKSTMLPAGFVLTALGFYRSYHALEERLAS